MNEKYITEYRQVLLALECIKKGSFGECDECSEMIAPRRLLAHPSASLCIDCQQSEETYIRLNMISIQKSKSRNSQPLSIG